MQATAFTAIRVINLTRFVSATTMVLLWLFLSPAMTLAGFGGGSPRAHPPSNIIHPNLIGIDISGLESNTVPCGQTYGVDPMCANYTNHNLVKMRRYPVSMKDLTNDVLGGPLNLSPGSEVEQIHNEIRQAALDGAGVGEGVLIDIHNSMHWNGTLPSPYTSNVFNAPGGPPAGIYADLIQKVATEFGGPNGTAGFRGIEIANEPFGMALNTDAPTIYQLSINSFREVDPVSWLYIDGDAFATVWGWSGDCHNPVAVTGTISGTTLTVSAVQEGSLAVGQLIVGTGIATNTTIIGLGSGTGGVGTYTVSASQTVSSTTISASSGANHFCGGEPSNQWATGGTGAWMAALDDPSKRLVAVGHDYGDQDGSGFYVKIGADSGNVAANAGCQTGQSSFVCATIIGNTLTNPTSVLTNNTGLDRANHSFVPWCEANAGKGGSIAACAINESGWPHDDANWIAEMNNLVALTQAHNIEFWYWSAGPNSRGYNPGGYGIEPDAGSYPKPNNGIELAVLDKYTNAPSPTYYFLEGPNRGSANQPSANFTIDYRGYVRTTFRVTPSDGGAGGTFTPAYVDCPPGFNCAATFTYTASGSGVYTISSTNNAQMSDPPALVYTTESDDFLANGISDNQIIAIYSDTKIYAPYVGPAVRLWRDDGAMQDFNFVSNDVGSKVDQAAITAWQGSHTIGLYTRYDQGPNHINDSFPAQGSIEAGMAPASTADYPQYQLNVQNGHSALFANHANRMEIPAPTNGLTAFSAFAVMAPTNHLQNGLFNLYFCCGQTQIIAWNSDYFNPSNMGVTAGRGYSIDGKWGAFATGFDSTAREIDSYTDGAHVDHAYNPNATGQFAAAPINFPYRAYIAHLWQVFGTSRYSGYEGELVLLKTKLSNAAAQNFQTRQDARWGITPHPNRTMITPTFSLSTTAANSFPWYGVNVAGLENATPLVPNGGFQTQAAAFWAGIGARIFRVPMRWESAQKALDGVLDPTFMGLVMSEVLAANAGGLDADIDLHNYGGYNSKPVNTAGGPQSADLADLWGKVAAYPGISSNPKVQFDIMNEPQNSVVNWMAAVQASINAIRANEAVPHWIHVEDVNYPCQSVSGSTGAGAHFKTLNDTQNMLILDCHAYMDGGNTGGSDIAVEGAALSMLSNATTYASANGIKLFIGENGIGPTPSMVAQETLFWNFILAHSNTIVGATFWGAGDFSSGYLFPMDPSQYAGTDPIVPAFGAYFANHYFNGIGWDSDQATTHYAPCYANGDACDAVLP
jgi:hypothetical protein